MKNKFIEINRLKNFILFFIVILALFAMAGCVEETVKVIVIPARTGPGGFAVFILFVVVFISAMFDKHKSVTPEQAEQQQIALQKQEAENERREKADLPAGLKPTDTNYIEFGTSTIGPHVVFNEQPNPETVYHVYTKKPGENWEEEDITNKFVQAMSDGTFRVILNTKNMISGMGGNRTVISWHENKNLITTKHPEQSTTQPSQEQTSIQSEIEATTQWQPSSYCENLLKECGGKPNDLECIHVRYINNQSTCQGSCAETLNKNLRNLGFDVNIKKWWEMDTASGSAGCVGYRSDLGGCVEGAKCLARILGPQYRVGSCNSDGFPYNVKLY